MQPCWLHLGLKESTLATGFWPDGATCVSTWVAANDATAVDDDVDAADTAKLLPSSPPGDHSKAS